MKTTLILLFVVVSIAVAYAGFTCLTDKDKCQEDECCVKRGPIHVCKKHKGDGERCEVHPAKLLIPDHVYLLGCPCQQGMKCIEKDGLVGKLVGTCQEDSSEVTEAE